jgi:hypothetical protein
VSEDMLTAIEADNDYTVLWAEAVVWGA